MSEYTPYLGLAKPSEDENYDIKIFNGNFEILDRRISNLEWPRDDDPRNMQNIMYSHDARELVLEVAGDAQYSEGWCCRTWSNYVEWNMPHIRLTTPVTNAPQRIMWLPDGFYPRNGPLMLPCVLFSNLDSWYDSELGFIRIDGGITVWKSASSSRDDLMCVGFHAGYIGG